MPTLTNALNTAFTPTVGDFIVQASPPGAVLERRNTAGAAWVSCLLVRGAATVANPVAGAQYRLMAQAGQAAPTVQADQ